MERLNIDLLDGVNPFEIDKINRPHLFKHYVGATTLEDGLDLLDEVFIHDNAVFKEADPPADWLMVGEIPGGYVIVPIAKSASGDKSKCRPIGLRAATEIEVAEYLEDVERLEISYGD